MEEKLTDQEQARREKLPRYEELGVDPFGARYDWKDRIVDIRKKVEGLTAEDLAALGGKSQMLYAYKVEIQLPYWKESRVFDCADYPADMAALVQNAKKNA